MLCAALPDSLVSPKAAGAVAVNAGTAAAGSAESQFQDVSVCPCGYC